MKVVMLLKRRLLNVVRVLICLVYDHYGDLIVEKHRRCCEQITARNNARLLENVQSAGEGITINGAITVSDPTRLLLGHQVSIDEGVYLETGGTLLIGDHVHLSRNVAVHTSWTGTEGLPVSGAVRNRPVVIGHHVRIGMNANIAHGVRIGDGAVIAPGARVTSDIPARVMDGDDESSGLRPRVTRRHEDRTLFFVVSTGRSGTTSIASMLSQHPDIRCVHERRPQLIRLSCAYSDGDIGRDELETHLADLYIRYGVLPPGCYGEANQKFFNMIERLSALLPASKFIWLLRDGRDVVSSTYERGWYCDDELSRCPGNHATRKYWRENRLNGRMAHAMSAADWNGLSPFGKNCWYWGYVNRIIQQQLTAIRPDRWRLVKLESLKDQLAGISGFLGVRHFEFSDLVMNASASVPYARHDWTAEDRQGFSTYCSDVMDAYYPGWRGTSVCD